MKVSLAVLGSFMALCAAAGTMAQDRVDSEFLESVAAAFEDVKQGPTSWDWPNQQAEDTAMITSDDLAISKRDLLLNRRKLAQRSTTSAQQDKRAVAAPEKYNLGNILAKRADYQQLTGGSGNAALESPSYLTYKVISNTSTFAVAKAACLQYCDSVEKCVTANMYQEIGNPLLDHVFSERSNRKCALFAAEPLVSQLTNTGGQQLYGESSPANYIINSVVFYQSDPGVVAPAGYTYAWGPITTYGHATLALIKFVGLSSYDPAACAKVCTSTRGCKFFNIHSTALSTYSYCDLYRRVISEAEATAATWPKGLRLPNSMGYIKKA